MDEKQQRQVNEAAEKFAESLSDAYRAVAGRSVSAQELNTQLTQDFFNGVINNLRTQAESNRALTEDLVEQQLRAVFTMTAKINGIRSRYRSHGCLQW
jgi:hypothetical protein